MNRILIRSVVLGAAVAVLGGCEDTLIVENPNQGETARVLATIGDAENLLGSYYKRWSSGVYGSTTNLEGMGNMYSLMNYSSLANNCQNAHTPFQGATNFNHPGNTCSGEQFRLYSILGEVNRLASTFTGKLDGGFSFGSTNRDYRARAFAEFLNGISLGYIAMVHDSSGIVTALTAESDEGLMYGYRQVGDSAMAALQRAIDAAAFVGTGVGGFPLPTTWIPSPTSFTAVEFTRLVRTYRARIRASMARTPAERAAVDWNAVIADAQNGITADHRNTTSTTVGPGNSWRSQYGVFGLWHQMPPFFIGMADVSGSYWAWVASPLGDRGAGNAGFFMVTPDLRFPQGTTRAAQQTDFAISSCQGAATPCKRYFVNRASGGDRFDGVGYGQSNYDFARFHSWRTSGDATQQNGATPLFMLSELRLLQAEGLYRQGSFAAAGALVNVSRTAVMAGTPLVAAGGGLPAITVFDVTTVVPGGAACVPRVPNTAIPVVVACGNLWDALKYEKRIETAYTHFMPWYFDGRGWGDLPRDTPIQWAVPFQELLARGRTFPQVYGMGIGPGNAPNSVASASSYGW